MNRQRLFIFFILLCSNAAGVFAQRNNSGDKYFAYDKDWKGVNSLDSATYFTRIRKVNDTCWEVHNYNLFGPMISKEVYKDEANKIAHGEWIFYKANGYMDSTCSYVDNLAHGSWYYINDTNRAYKEKVFEKGRLIEVVDLIKEDSIEKAKADTAKKVERVEKESEFPGGLSGWARYLQKNLKYPERAINREIQGMVVVQFIVDTEGNVQGMDLYKSVEYSIDDEAKRLIVVSPKWKPGTQDGKKVKTYKRQPIVFRLQ